MSVHISIDEGFWRKATQVPNACMFGLPGGLVTIVAGDVTIRIDPDTWIQMLEERTSRNARQVVPTQPDGTSVH